MIRNRKTKANQKESRIDNQTSKIEHQSSSIEHPVSNIQHRAAKIRYQESSIKNPASSKEDPVSSIQHPASTNSPFIIPIFIPHAGCPHQCAFCNQTSITGFEDKIPTPEEIYDLVERHLKFKGKQRDTIEIAFFGGNFLGINTEQIVVLLKSASAFVKAGKVDGIRFSTRPDTVDRKHIELIYDFPVSTVELGVQSMDDHVLALSRRGHTAADTMSAVGLLKERNYEIGIQIMVGLPGENRDGMLANARQIADLKPDFVRIYPTLVIEGSPLARWFQKGKYTPLNLESAVDRAKELYLFFTDRGIKVIRMGLQASEDLNDGSTVLDGPYHPAFGHMVHSEIFLDKALAAINSEGFTKNRLTISVHPRSISKMRGLNNSNVKKLKNRFQFNSIEVLPDASLGEDDVKIAG